MSSADALKTFFTVLGVVIGIPIVLVMVKVGMFFGSLSRSVTALELAATTFTAKVDRILEKIIEKTDDHEIRLTLAEQFIDAERIARGQAPDRRRKKEGE